MPPQEEHHIEILLDRLLAERGMTLTELAGRVGLTLANLSILKNGRARAIRFSTLNALCDALGCQPGDLLIHRPEPAFSASALTTTESTPQAADEADSGVATANSPPAGPAQPTTMIHSTAGTAAGHGVTVSK